MQEIETYQWCRSIHRDRVRVRNCHPKLVDARRARGRGECRLSRVPTLGETRIGSSFVHPYYIEENLESSESEKNNVKLEIE
jgi:hypothetical protein